MRSFHADPSAANSLRFVFEDAVISLQVPPDATLGDVARLWGEIAEEYHAKPVNIKVTLAAPERNLSSAIRGAR